MTNTAITATQAGWHLENTYAQLPDTFFSATTPTRVMEPKIVIFNHELAEFLGLNGSVLNTTEGAGVFSGNAVAEGSAPIAQAYAGHQFGYFTVLGDGRAILLGEQLTPEGKRFDIQLKGSGQTPYSRRGDGRAALGPMLREYIISEAMAALGIPTTRSLAVVTTGEPVYRESVLPGAVLTRVASSHLRVGTFQYAILQDNTENLRALADYTIQRHYPECAKSDTPYLDLLKSVMEKQASLISKWQLVGFVHGVMNTDNMTLSGESIDYGPCAFIDRYDPATVFSSIDQQGRYAYANQPIIAQWNLARFTETLLPLLHPEQDQAITLGQQAIESFPTLYAKHWITGMRAKLGLFNEEAEDATLAETLLNWMQQSKADFTQTFRMLSNNTLPDEECFEDSGFQHWHTQWQERLSRQGQSVDEAKTLMKAHNPAIIPRNHQVELALEAANKHGDIKPTQQLLDALKDPYADPNETSKEYSLPPEPSHIPYQTFCGT